jgi:hypothetical protein
MHLEVIQANTVRSLGKDGITLAEAGVAAPPTPTAITCALPSINRTAILAGIGLAVCTYLVFHPASAHPPPSSHHLSPPPTALHEHQIKAQILFCTAAHSLVNRRVESAMAFAISWLLWTITPYALSLSSQDIAITICQSDVWINSYPIFQGCNVDRFVYWIEFALHFVAATLYLIVYFLFHLLLIKFTKSPSVAPTSLADSLQRRSSFQSPHNAADTIISVLMALTPEQIISFLFMCFSFVMLVVSHYLWDRFPQVPFIVALIESYFVATASIPMPLHHVLVFDSVVAAHISSSALATLGLL